MSPWRGEPDWRSSPRSVAGSVHSVRANVLDSALDVTKAERGFVMLPTLDGELEFRTARGRGHVTLPGTSFTTSAKIPKEVFRTGKSQMVGDLMDKEEDLTQEMESLASKSVDSLDKGAGWDAADGPWFTSNRPFPD